MKKVIATATLAMGIFSAQVMAGDGPNPCEWEHDPQPAYCQSEGTKWDTQKNRIAPVKREQDYSGRFSGGDR